jgi:pimeloyl-ACP methyl ester carboxylesterase
MPYVEVNDIRMYYEEQGQGDPLVLLHGGTGGLDFRRSSWTALLPALAERYRAICIEHRGHGRTTNPAAYLSYDQMAGDLGAFIERLALAPAHVAGVSDGGITALRLAMVRPALVRSLVCVGTNYTNDEQSRAANAMFDPDVIAQELPAFAAALAGFHDPHHYPGYWRTLVEQIRANIADNPAFTVDDLRRVEAPTLLVAGEADPWANLAQMVTMRQAISRAELLILNCVSDDPIDSHCVQHARPELVGPVMLDFLRRHAGSALEEGAALLR